MPGSWIAWARGKWIYSTTLARSNKQAEDWKEGNSFNEDDPLAIARLSEKACNAIKKPRQAEREG